MRGRGLGFGLLTAALVLLACEGISRLAIGLLEGHGTLTFERVESRFEHQSEKLRQLLAAEDTLLRLHPRLGWVYAPNVHADRYSSNADGVRGTRDYAPTPPPGVLRVAAFGDSFVHGNEVADDEAWSARLEALDPRVEVLNYGVGGYGLDQALLYFEERGFDLAPDVVVLGFAEPDYARSVNRYRRFLRHDELPLFKPRFKLTADGELELVPNPFPSHEAMARLLEEPRRALEAAADDWYFEPLVWRNPLYDRLAVVRAASTLATRVWRSRLRPDRPYRDGVMNPDFEGFRLLVELVKRFRDRVRAHDRELLFVIFPGRDSDIWGQGPRVYAPLLEALGDTWTLDLADVLAADPKLRPAGLRAPSGHYSGDANLLVAQGVHAALLERNLISAGDPLPRLASQARPAVDRWSRAED